MSRNQQSTDYSLDTRTPRPAAGNLGASISTKGVTYRTWAPDHKTLSVLIAGSGGEREVSMTRDIDGYFQCIDERGQVGDVYQYQTEKGPFPDPTSRFQADGPFGMSHVVDPRGFHWTAKKWKRPAMKGRVIYELHIGTFTPKGTFRAAAEKLPYLVDLGINAIEIMPVACFPGRRGWGYDGVFLFAPSENYGCPDDLRFLIDTAHAHGIAVILDVVYNHIGPVGNVLPHFAESYFDSERRNVWGAALNFPSPPVRDFFLQNVAMWLDEYRIDGLRLDAVHAIDDSSPLHIVAEIAAEVKQRGAFVIAEDERNEVKVLSPASAGGWELDGVWADDFHHTVRVALTGQREAHFASFTGAATEWVQTLETGWLYQGQYSPHVRGPRGTPAGHCPTHQFVLCISNHDQVGNRPLGERLNMSIDVNAYRALSVLLCFVPYTPMLFMGQEFGAQTPFLYFTDLPGEIGDRMAENRRKEFSHYGADYDEVLLSQMPDPQKADTFGASKLDWKEAQSSAGLEILNLYRQCLHLRQQHAIFQNPARHQWEVGSAGTNVVALRWTEPHQEWLLAVTVEAGWHLLDGAITTEASRGPWKRVLSSRMESGSAPEGLCGPEAVLFCSKARGTKDSVT